MNRLPRNGMLWSSGTPDAVSVNSSLMRPPSAIIAPRKRGKVCPRKTGALSAAVDAVIAANPEVADKVREGKVQAAGALIGEVMKQMKGQADAAKARELILTKLGAS